MKWVYVGGTFVSVTAIVAAWLALHGGGLTCTGALVSPSSLVSRVSAAAPGDVLCLQSGDYGTWAGAGAKAITVVANPGDSPQMTFDFGSDDNGFTVDGMTAAGGDIINAANITVKNTTFLSPLQVTETGSSGIVLDHDDFTWHALWPITNGNVNSKLRIDNPTSVWTGVTVRDSSFGWTNYDDIHLGGGADIIDNTFIDTCEQSHELPITASASTDIISEPNAVYPNGLPLTFSSLTGGGGLSGSTTYYTINSTGSTYKVSTSSGGSPVNITSNVTGGFADYEDPQHTDPLQWEGGVGGDVRGNLIITRDNWSGGYFTGPCQVQQTISSFDGVLDGTVIEDNVVDTPWNWPIEMMGAKNVIVRHNTLVHRPPGNTSYPQPNGVVDIEMGHAVTHTQGIHIYDNVMTELRRDGTDTGTVIDHNLCLHNTPDHYSGCNGVNGATTNISGSPTFTGGSDPSTFTTYSEYCLAAGSAGKGAGANASGTADGTDMGIEC